MTAKKTTTNPKKNPGKSSAAKAASASKTGKEIIASRVDSLVKEKKPKTNRLPKGKPLSEQDLQYFFQLLLEKRRELVGDVDHMNDEAMRNGSTGEISNMPIHMADIGTDNYEQEFMLGLIESERKMLRDIDRALAKIKDGTYGICEGTGEPIERARLEARPEARYCIEYARKIEQGMVPRPVEDTFLLNAARGEDDEEDSQ